MTITQKHEQERLEQVLITEERLKQAREGLARSAAAGIMAALTGSDIRDCHDAVQGTERSPEWLDKKMGER